MKVTCLLFLTMSCASLMLGTTYAAASNPASQQASPENSGNAASEHLTDAGHAAPADEAKPLGRRAPFRGQNGHHVASNANHVRSYASVVNANRPKTFPNSQQRLMAGSPRNQTQAGANQSSAVTGDGLTKNISIQNKKVSSARAVRPPAMLPSSSSSLESVHHRGSNPAVVDGAANVGLANSKTGNTAAINGTLMKHRP